METFGENFPLVMPCNGVRGVLCKNIDNCWKLDNEDNHHYEVSEQMATLASRTIMVLGVRHQCGEKVYA